MNMPSSRFMGDGDSSDWRTMAENPNSSSRELQPLKPPDGLSTSDYEMIEDAVMETARGRWFLKEYARRMRAAETAGLRVALERIERMIVMSHPPHAENAKQADAGEKLEGVSERLLDLAWYMRERGIDSASCTSIEREAREIASVAALLNPSADDDAEPSRAESQEASMPPDPNPRAQEAHQEAHGGIVMDDAAAEWPPLNDEPHTRDVPQYVQAFDADAETAPAQTKAIEPAPVQPSAPTPSLAERLMAFVHIERMPVRQRLALFA